MNRLFYVITHGQLPIYREIWPTAMDYQQKHDI
jgi:hypothetical protein